MVGITHETSCSGLTRASVSTRSSFVINFMRAAKDSRARPENDGAAKIAPPIALNLMPMRIDRAIAFSIVLIAMTRSSRVTTNFVSCVRNWHSRFKDPGNQKGAERVREGDPANGWRSGPESNRHPRICSPMHHHSATGPPVRAGAEIPAIGTGPQPGPGVSRFISDNPG